MCVPTGETDNHEFVDISCSKLVCWGKKKEQRPKNGKEEQEGYHPTLKLSDSKGKRIPTTGEDYRKEVFSNGGRISEKESKRLYLDKRLGIQLLIMNQEFQRRNSRNKGEEKHRPRPSPLQILRKTDGQNGAPETLQDPSGAKKIFLSNPGQKIDDYPHFREKETVV